ncbi:MAG: STY4851/ECs_5259 family protein [Albidovulum sp.]|nr:STY4851/ECs_5259 family protein [Albidovulum sp.]
MNILTRIISANELTCPDGRPLFRYRLSVNTFAELEEMLRLHVVSGHSIELAAPQFVLWAAEHIRSRFAGGPLKWAFVLEPLDLPSDDQALGRRLAERGLQWWDRKIKQSNVGHSLFLYSLLAEGGIPEALLRESRLYRNAVMGLLAEIEAEGGTAAEPWVEQMALRWRSRLPQTFQNTEFTSLLAGLALSLAYLRALLPNDLPEAGAEQWLNKHRPDWTSSIPLRMTQENAQSLICPALRAERNIRPVASGPLCGRELRRGVCGSWQGYLYLHDNGWLQESYFLDAAGLRLRLLSAGSGVTEGVAYNATPEEQGWRLRRLGKGGRTSIPLNPSVPFAFSAFADGQAKGEAVIDAGIPHPIESPSFWRPAELSEGASADRLTPLTGAAQTRGPCLWILAPENEEPEVSDGLTLDEVETAPDGILWRLSGKGALQVGEKRYRIETGAEEDAPDARLFAFGETLRGWRLGGNIPVYRGNIEIHGQLEAGHFGQIPESELRRAQGRELCSDIVEWMRKDEILARLRLVHLPESVNLSLHEVSAGRIALSADGLAAGWRLRLNAGDIEAAGELQDGATDLTLDTPGTAPGLVRLRLSEPATGRALEIQAAWPARSGMIVGPDGTRLERNQAISVKALQGWRAVTPDGRSGDLQLQLTGSRAVSLPIAGEVSIASHLPSIQAMLAQGGPDSQVNLSLVVSGREGPRLEIRRYHDNAIVEDGLLWTGLDRDAPETPETVLASRLNEAHRAIVRAVNLRDSDRIGPIKTSASVNLASHLEQSGGSWLVQSTLEGRVQRAVVWNPQSHANPTRQERIDYYTQHWHELSTAPQDPDWDRVWQLISAVGEDGDIGVLDQVQALAMVPVAAIALALRVPPEELSEVLALETAAPIFWPALKVTDFATAVRTEHSRQRQKLAQYFDDDEATEVADHALAQRIGDIFHLRPDLAGHFCMALLEAGLLARMVERPETHENLSGLLLASPGDRLVEAAQEAAKRFDRLPQGVGGLQPVKRPKGFPVFNPYVQAMIDAPLLVAEMATERRSAPDVEEKLVLINLRLVDPLYFDTALPAALALCMSSDNR